MKQHEAIKRLRVTLPLAVILVAYNLYTEGMAATWRPFKIYIPGVLVLVPLFKWLGLWR